MNTLIVDDRQPVVNEVRRILYAIDPEGTHTGVVYAHEALQYAAGHPVDVAFLDIVMPGMNGLELAQGIKKLKGRTNIVFVTGHSEYALEAHMLYASGFLMKPVSKEDVQECLDHLRYPLEGGRGRVRIQCFGKFEAFYGGVPLPFQRKKTKELLACLVDCRGAMCSNAQIISCLWEDDRTNHLSYLKNLRADLLATLREADCCDIIVRQRGMIGIVPERIDCDYYDWIAGKPSAVNVYHGEYMGQYSWAEFTNGFIESAFRRT